MLRRNNKSQGQALVEFALILTVLLMLLFLIIESARILQGWVTVQNAARAGARYAITGRNDVPCSTETVPKFLDRCDDLRVASVIAEARTALAGLPLDEDPDSLAFGSPPDENAYYIEVYGGFVDENGAQLLADYAGMPGQPVVVRVVYNVPIITPFFRPIISVIPVFGQVTMNNENFGSLGNPTQGLGLPPDLVTIPTVGASPTPTPSPTPTATPEPGTPTNTPAPPTNTPSPTPVFCGAFIERAPVAGDNFMWVSGEPGETVRIIDANTGALLGQDTFLAVGNHLCPGFADFNDVPLNPVLTAGHVILAVPSAGQPASAIVLQNTPTVTPTPSPTLQPTSTPSPTPTTAPTATPGTPYIRLIPNCSIGSEAQFEVLGFNWPNADTIGLFWNGAPQQVIPAGHGGTFVRTWTRSNLVVGTQQNPTIYTVSAQTNNWVANATFQVPCSQQVVPTPVATVTPTPAPADLIVVGQPELLSTRPLVAYQPISVRVVISNTGDVDVSSQFFVDVYFDPPQPVTTTISLDHSVGYMGVSSLQGRTSRVITITAPLGFANLPDPHTVYGMVDSLNQVGEVDETNNVSQPLIVGDVTPAATPTPTLPAPSGDNEFSGVVLNRITTWLPQPRALVTLVDEGTGIAIGSQLAESDGFYRFDVPDGTYTVKACVSVDNTTYFGLQTGLTAPTNAGDVFMLEAPCN